MSLAKTASLRQMLTFRTVARLGSVSMAAEELHLSQSAVSIQIGSLEASAGAPLVNRTGRGVRLTEAGELLLTYADRLLALWTETSDEVATFLGEFSGTLRVCAVTTVEYWLPRILVNFLNDNPKVKIKLQVANRDEIVRSLASQEVDIAVMGRPPEELKVSAAAIAKNPMAFLSAPNHPLMSVGKLTMARLAEEPLLVRERGSGTRTTVERLFKEAGLRMRIGSELSSNEAIKQMCAAGFGPAYLSLHTCILEMNAGLLTMLPLPNNLVEREWFVVHAAAKDLPQVAVAFERFLCDHAQTEILQQFGQQKTKLTLKKPGDKHAGVRPGRALST
jgi:LysR family transcriptional regulator, low CO2-responsive transcriptional regulator